MRGRLQVSFNDMILMFSFAYSGVDIIGRWHQFDTCSKPIQLWLLVSYLTMTAFRVSHYLGQYFSEEGEDFMLYLRQRGPTQTIIRITWILLLPFFSCWTVLGTIWSISILRETPECLPAGTNTWFLIFWQVLCYVWIAIYAIFISIACVLERRVEAAEREHGRILGTPDVLRRWGQLPFLPDYGSLSSKGLSHTQIKALPSLRFGDSDEHHEHLTEVRCLECPICISEFKEEDACRQLPGCNHMFHQSCIDLWLLRRGDCPLCKQPIEKVAGVV